MDVYEAIRARYSCRAYQTREIEPEKMKHVLEAARLAPSARNFQDWRFVVVTDAATKKKLVSAANNQAFLGQAGAIIVGCSESDHVMRCGQAVGPIDVAIALEHTRLPRRPRGLRRAGSGRSTRTRCQILDIPQEIAIIELMATGIRRIRPGQSATA